MSREYVEKIALLKAQTTADTPYTLYPFFSLIYTYTGSQQVTIFMLGKRAHYFLAAAADGLFDDTNEHTGKQEKEQEKVCR
uniref:Uncharacterized protein n=1 Tax=Ditylenchus dipsaci TaxID=166011 RepID=A0A915DEY4_9BILA